MAQDHSCDHHGVPFRSLSDHLAAVLAVGKPTATRTVATEESAGLVLAEDARANLPVPPFSNSAMDGFLVRAADLPAGGAGDCGAHHDGRPHAGEHRGAHGSAGGGYQRSSRRGGPTG